MDIALIILLLVCTVLVLVLGVILVVLPISKYIREKRSARKYYKL